MASDKRVFEFCPPSPLHILLGIVNDMYKKMHSFWPNEVSDWQKDSLAKREAWHSGQFQGNQCVYLLENIGFLDNLRILEMQPCIVALKAFNEVRKACFSIKFESDFAEKIAKFKRNFDDIVELQGMSVTPKVHELYFHVREFIDKVQVGLGKLSEQTGESLHHDFAIHYERFQRYTNPEHPNYAQNLKATVVAYNSKHI